MLLDLVGPRYPLFFFFFFSTAVGYVNARIRLRARVFRERCVKENVALHKSYTNSIEGMARNFRNMWKAASFYVMFVVFVVGCVFLVLAMRTVVGMHEILFGVLFVRFCLGVSQLLVAFPSICQEFRGLVGFFDSTRPGQRHPLRLRCSSKRCKGRGACLGRNPEVAIEHVEPFVASQQSPLVWVFVKTGVL